MSSEEFDRKVFELIKQLQACRRQYRRGVQELQEMGRKMTIMVGLLADSPTDIRMSSDRESVEFSDEEGGDEDQPLFISRFELEALPNLIGQTLGNSREIDQLEEYLTNADFGDFITPNYQSPSFIFVILYMCSRLAVLHRYAKKGVTGESKCASVFY